jgi:hypothetical protein
MKVRKDGAKVVIEEKPVIVPAVFAVSSIVLLGIAISIQLGFMAHEQPAWAAFLLSVFTAGIAAVFFRRERNVFDSDTRRLTWSKWTLLRRTGGTIPFVDITSIAIESQSSSETVPSCRITVRTNTEAVPLSRFYSGSVPSHEPIAELVRSLVGLGSQDLTQDSVQAMVAAGHKIDAIRFLRIKKGLSLEDAKKEVERLS